MDINHLTQKQACALLGVEDRTLRNWAKEDPPIPSHGSGKSLSYVWSEVFDWWRKREFRSLLMAANKKESKTPDSFHYAAVEQQADAEIKLIKLAEARRQVANLGDVERKMAGIMAKVRIQCMSIYPRVLPKLGPEHAELVNAEVVRALTLLSGKGGAE